MLRDTAIALLVAVASCLHLLTLRSGALQSHLAAAAMATIAAATLAFRRRRPELPLVAGLAVGLATDEHTLLFAAAYAVAHYGGRLRFVLVATVCLLHLIGQHTAGMADPGSEQGYYGVIAWIILPAVLGGFIRRQRSLHALLREQRARSTSGIAHATRFVLLEERTRLAFDIHDHVGHQATFLVLQAGALQAVQGIPEEARQGVVALQASAQRVMAALRQTLDVLQDTGGRQPKLSGPTSCADFLSGLVRNMSAVGMAAEYQLHGTVRPLPVRTEHLLYQLCRETLTNAAKHAPGALVRVDLSFEEDQITLEVHNGPPSGPAPPCSSGRMGLAGLRLRVEAAGGRLTACSRRDGGFRVMVHLPAPRDTESWEACGPVPRGR